MKTINQNPKLSNNINYFKSYILEQLKSNGATNHGWFEGLLIGYSIGHKLSQTTEDDLSEWFELQWDKYTAIEKDNN